jgi:hypothetical protein
VSTCSFSYSPGQPTGTWRWTSFLGRPGGERGAPASAHAKRRRPRSAVDTHASHALATHDHPFPPGPIRAATTKPLADHSDTSNPLRPNVGCPAAPTHSRIQRGADSADAAAADTGRVSVRTPRNAPVVDTGRLDTGRPPDQLDGRADGGQRTGPSDERRGRRPDIFDGHDDGGRRLGGANLRGDDTCRRGDRGGCAALLGMKPRLGALLSCVGFGWYEERAMGQRKGKGVRGQAGEEGGWRCLRGWW